MICFVAGCLGFAKRCVRIRMHIVSCGKKWPRGHLHACADHWPVVVS